MVAGLTSKVKFEVVKRSFDFVSLIADKVRINASQFISPLQLSDTRV